MRTSMKIVLCTFAITGCATSVDSAPEDNSSALRVANPVARCGTHEPTPAEVSEVEATEAATATTTAARRRNVTIPVYAHVITTTAGDGDVSDLVPAQIDVLNAAYGSAGFRFDLVSTEVIANDVWYTAAADSPEELEMKTALRVGGPESLNLYTGVNDDTLLGWATFPWWYDDSAEDAVLDGIVLAWGSLPGGDLVFDGVEDEPDGVINYAEGDTGTHEVGHWLGLFHTFESNDYDTGCEGPGDRIWDTPAEAEPQFYCVERDSCSSYGSDPIDNFMDYVDDDCMTHFSAGQKLRMRVLHPFYRS